MRLESYCNVAETTQMGARKYRSKGAAK